MNHSVARDIKAAVIREEGAEFTLEDLRLGAPGPLEVMVRVVAAGMCHTDLIIRDQYYPTPLPVVLGHEGSGIVEAVGDAVTAFEPGDHVVMSFMSCGICHPCQSGHPCHCDDFFALNFGGCRKDGSTAVAERDGDPIHDHFFGQSSFSTYAIAHQRNLVKVDADAPLELLGPLGCGIQTGAGAVLNSLGVGAGQSFASFGAGAVGLSAVMAAQVAGATTIIAVDVQPNRLELAKDCGATHTINSKETDPVEAIREITGGGAHVSVEALGIPATTTASLACLRPLGRHVQIGMPTGAHARMALPMDLVYGRQLALFGTRGMPAWKFPRLFAMLAAGRIDPAPLVGRRIALADASAELAAMDGPTPPGVAVITRF